MAKARRKFQSRFHRQNARRTMDGGSLHCTGGGDQNHP